MKSKIVTAVACASFLLAAPAWAHDEKPGAKPHAGKAHATLNKNLRLSRCKIDTKQAHYHTQTRPR